MILFDICFILAAVSLRLHTTQTIVTLIGQSSPDLSGVELWVDLSV